MKKSLFVFAVLVVAGAACPNIRAQQKYETYSNARFAYTLDYPAQLLSALGESDNGDGQIFRSRDGSVELFVWGQQNALSRTLKYELERDLKKPRVTYKVLFPDGYALSRISRGKIYYQKTILLGNDGDKGAIFATFVLAYPVSQKAKFDPIVRRIAQSFRFN